jgi:hypothetical protein
MEIFNEGNQKNKKPWADGVTQVVECLPSKYETLSSNPSTTKNQNQTNKQKNQTKFTDFQYRKSNIHCPKLGTGLTLCSGKKPAIRTTEKDI